MKNFKQLYKKKSVFAYWLLSYVLILLIPVIVSAIALFFTVDVLEFEIGKANSASLNQLQRSLDTQLYDVQRIANEINLDDRIRSIMSYRGELEPFHVLAQVDIIENLRTYLISNSFIEELYIYFPSNDFILSNNYKYNTNEYYDFYGKYININFDEWKNILTTYNYGTFYTAMTKESPSTVKRDLLFVQSIPIEDKQTCLASIVIKINENKIYKVINDLNWIKEGKILISNSDNDIISMTSQEISTGFINFNDFDGKQDILYRNIEGQDYVIAYDTSEVTDWKYILILPEKVFLERAKYVENTVKGIIFSCLAVGIILAYFLTKRNYSPINRIISIFNGSKPHQLQKGENDFSYIENSIIEIMDEDKAIKERLERQKDALKNSFIVQLLKGHVKHNASLEDMCEAYNIDLMSGEYAVLLFYMEDLKGFLTEQNIHNDKDNMDLVYFVFQNIFEEMSRPDMTIHMAEIDDLLACIIQNVSSENNNIFKGAIVNLVENAKLFIENKIKIEFSVSISSVHLTIDDLPLAYQEALEALEYKLVTGRRQIIDYDIISKSDRVYNQKVSYLEGQHQFLNAIKASDYKNAKIILNNFFDSNLFKGELSIQIIKCRMFGLINIMINVINEIENNINSELWDKMDMIDGLLNCKSIIDLQTQMNVILTKVDIYISEKKEEENSQIIKKVENYIAKHYSDNNLSVSMISENFDNDPTYLSRIFKKKTGSALLEYIHKYRIEQAKIIMQDNEQSIKDIAEKVGYINSHAFIRVFKKYEGVTPGKFKEIDS